jgi:hypothetical protein
MSTSNVNEPLVCDESLSRKLTFHVWASKGHTVIFLRIQPLQHLFREMVIINDSIFNYIIGARAHEGNWQPQRNRNFREFLST